MIPVILIHYGNSERYPLNIIINQSRRFGNETTLIGDPTNGAEHQIADYNHEAEAFAQHYEHLSTNSIRFEEFCIIRWFILREWMTQNRVDLVLYIDSDVLLYANAETEWKKYRDCALTLALGTSPATSYFTLAGLGAFLDFVLDVYVNRNDNFVEFQRIFRDMRAQNLPGGACDMTLFKFFKEQTARVKVGEMTDIIEGATWDHNINASDGYETAAGTKLVRFVEGKPFVLHEANDALVQFNSLHFQGRGKPLIQRFARL